MYAEGTTMHEVRTIRDQLSEEYASLNPEERQQQSDDITTAWLNRQRQLGRTVEKTAIGYRVS